MIKLLVIVIGNLGSGKTLIVLILSLCYNRDIWSNFEIKIPNYKELDIPDLFNLPNNIVVIMDEGYAWIESRVSSSALNEYVSSIIFHTRKTFTDIYLTTPMLSTIDKRFRHQANYIIECEHRSNFESDDFKYTFNDIDNNSYSKYTLSYNNAKKYFKLYDTYEKVDSHRKKGLEFNILKHYPKRLKIRVKEIIEIVQKHIIDTNQNGKITHDKLKGYLFDLEIDLNYEPYVYIRMKGK